MRLGKYFTAEEMSRTSLSESNAPTLEAMVNIIRLVTLVLDPLREAVGRLFVSSGFRSFEVNRLAGGASTSYHLSGCAADVVSGEGRSVEELVEAIKFAGLPFDKVIMEYRDGKSWLHIQVAPVGGINRGEVYKAEFDRDRDKMVYTLI